MKIYDLKIKLSECLKYLYTKLGNLKKNYYYVPLVIFFYFQVKLTLIFIKKHI